ncbi:hypothetical protein U1Q18_033884 [Sarracenia purpurea var. burkii]
MNGAEVPCIKPETSSEEKLKVPCIKPETSSEEKLTSGPVSHVGRPFHVEPSEVLQLHVDEPSEVLQQVQLECIASSSEIRDALKDNELQKLICNIDCSLDAENELNKAMEVEAFRMFTDKLLSTISPQQ